MNEQRKIVLFIAMSLDGYIATKDDSLDWLFKVEGEGDNGFQAFYETVDTVFMGKRTYDWIMRHVSGEFPYKDKHCFVVSRTIHEERAEVTFISGDVVSFIDKLKDGEGKNIWVVGGGELISLFVREKLIDELIITVAPVLIGSGIPLFHEGDYHLALTLKKVQRFNQFVELHYAVNK